MNSIIKTIRFFFRFIVPLLLITNYLLKKFVFVHHPALQIIHIILLSVIVGYFTNFIAIKMLFRPRDKTVFGRQGLIPKNQMSIAISLGRGISSNFFNAHDIIEYIKKENLSQKSIDWLKTHIDSKLKDKNFQSKMIHWLKNKFSQYQEQLKNILIKLSDRLKTYLLEKTDFTFLVRKISELVENNLDKETIIKIADSLSTFISVHSQQLSILIHEKIQTYIDEQGFIKKNVLRFINWLASLDQDKIKNKLNEIISSKKFRNEIYGFLEIGVSKFSTYLHSEKGKNELYPLINKVVGRLNQMLKEKGFPYLIEKVESILSDESAWEKIEKSILLLIDLLKRELDQVLKNEDKIEASLQSFMPKLLEKFQISEIIIQKVKSFDTNQLEKLIMDASGEHLGWIEILGGFLGGITGIAIFNVEAFGFILAGLGTLGLIEYLIGKMKKDI